MNDPGDALSFAERILALIDQGRTTATYKYALLLALMDICMARTGADGRAPASVTTHEVALRILELYWPQTSPFAAAGGSLVLRQNSKGQAGIVSAIQRFREVHAADPSAPLSTARRSVPRAFERLVARVEWKLIEMPIPRLQFVGAAHDPFIYTIGWDTTVTPGQAARPGFPRRLDFAGAAGDHLVRLAGLLRPLIEAKWIELVTRFNAGVIADPGLAPFLFGAQRISTARLVPALRELQGDACFFCGGALRGRAEVDHFIPWARVPDNGIENLVLADARCNGDKRAFVAAPAHLERWAERFRERRLQESLAAIADDCGWDQHPERTLGVARAVYFGLPASADLWLLGREFVHPDAGVIATTLGATG